MENVVENRELIIKEGCASLQAIKERIRLYGRLKYLKKKNTGIVQKTVLRKIRELEAMYSKRKRESIKNQRRINKEIEYRIIRASQSRKRLYGMSQFEYEKLLKEQNGLCYLCSQKNFKGNTFMELALCVDHHHETRKNRKLLCNRCNTVIGFVNEDTALLGRMIAYLEEFN